MGQVGRLGHFTKEMREDRKTDFRQSMKNLKRYWSKEKLKEYLFIFFII